jgi:type IV secretion system protein TrbL
MLVSLLLLVMCVQGRHTIRIFNIGSAYETRKAKRSAWTGAFLIVTWYWVAVLALYLVDGFTIALIPDISTVTATMIELLRLTVSNPALALFLTGVGAIAMWILQALFFLREILLYILIYAMPIGIALAYGNLPVVSHIARTVCMKFVPLAIMPIPVALLFKGYELLFSEGTDSALVPDSSFLSYLIAVTLPLLSILIVWKLFKYASPMTTKIIGATTKGAVTAGAVVGAGVVAGPAAAATTAAWGPKAAAGYTAASKMRQGGGSSQQSGNPSGSGGRTDHDNVATDAYGQEGVPAYRRTENDPGYY